MYGLAGTFVQQRKQFQTRSQRKIKKNVDAEC